MEDPISTDPLPTPVPGNLNISILETAPGKFSTSIVTQGDVSLGLVLAAVKNLGALRDTLFHSLLENQFTLGIRGNDVLGYLHPDLDPFE